MTRARWQDANGSGIEHCQLDRDANGLRLSGVVAGIRDSGDGGFYIVTATPGSRTRDVLVWLTSGTRMHLRSDGMGRWHDLRDGSALPALQGAIDVDLGMTPATNTLPILRLGLAVGQSAQIQAAYVPLPGEFAQFQARRMAQRYTRLDRDLYLYESLGSNFSAQLRIDGDGLVRDYPGLYRRL